MDRESETLEQWDVSIKSLSSELRETIEEQAESV